MCLTVFRGADNLVLEDELAFESGSEADAALDELLDELNEPVMEDVGADGAAAVDALDGPAQLYGGFDDDTEEPAVLEVEEERPVQPGVTGTDPARVEAEAAATEAAGAELARSGEAAPAAAVDSTAVEAPEAQETAEAEPASRPDAAGTTGPAAAEDEIELIEQGAYDPHQAPEEPEWLDDSPVKEAHPSEAADALERRIRASGEITFKREPRRWWVGLVIGVFLLALVAQVFYFQLPSWSRDPGLRPIYEAVCGMFGCELPQMRDLSRMDTRNLVVRSHPDMGSALVVDAIIVNLAEYPQAFPDLELRFTEVGGTLVAARRFAPEEYLAGELAGARLMPAHTPIQVSLEIEDPGPDAVNYTLSFR